MQYFIGCSGFHNKDWKEEFYPKGLAQRKWFEYYCTKFNSLELNTTFYRFPQLKTLHNWYTKSPDEFRFSVKVPRLITHYKQFNDVKRLLSDFYDSVKNGLQEKLSAVLFQLPARTKYNETFLNKMIDVVDTSVINVFEFRNAGWWNNDVFNRLSQHNIIFCGQSISDLPEDLVVNTNIAYYRFHGITELYFSEYPKEAIEDFAKQLKQQSTIKEAFIYFNNTATMAAIHNANQLKQFLF